MNNYKIWLKGGEVIEVGLEDGDLLEMFLNHVRFGNVDCFFTDYDKIVLMLDSIACMIKTS